MRRYKQLTPHSPVNKYPCDGKAKTQGPCSPPSSTGPTPRQSGRCRRSRPPASGSPPGPIHRALLVFLWTSSRKKCSDKKFSQKRALNFKIKNTRKQYYMRSDKKNRTKTPKRAFVITIKTAHNPKQRRLPGLFKILTKILKQFAPPPLELKVICL